MSDTVCCPTCWSWSRLGTASACKQCGTPLIFADGRLVGPEPVTGDAGEAVTTAPTWVPPRRWSGLRALLHRSAPPAEVTPAEP